MKDKARAIVGRLLKELWPEIYKASVYLWNRTPRYMHDWKPLYELFFNEKPIRKLWMTSWRRMRNTTPWIWRMAMFLRG